MPDVIENDRIHRFDLSPGPGNTRNSEGDFIQLADGRLLFIYSHFTTGEGEDQDAACLMSRCSTDGGRTWSDRDEVVVPNEGRMNVMSVSLLRLSNGERAFFYVRKNSWADCRPVMRISHDQAATWGEPIECIMDEGGYYVVNNNRVIQLNSGRLLMPTAQHGGPREDGGFVSRGRVMCYLSDDFGRSWRRSRSILELEESPDNVEGLREPAVVELKDGQVMMLIRTSTGSQYLSWSRDGGETWSRAAASAIASPCSPASIRRVPATGDLLLIWNQNGVDHRRTPLNLAISRDEGGHWENVKTLEDHWDGWFCYTAMAFVDTSLLLAYCAGNQGERTGLATTRIVRLPMDWIYSE